MSYLEELLPEFRKGAKIREWSWDRGHYIYLRNGKIYDECNEALPYSLNGCSDWFLSNKWEIYNDPELDWDYIIKNKCLCWLWDDNYNWAICGTLGKIEKGDEYKFVMFDDEGNRSPYKNCRPVSRDEVTFYEERKDE
jgi:hypothetical protein